ncbi:hypothetical protein ACVWZD_001048 [Streptomyces sp. TE3672]
MAYQPARRRPRLNPFYWEALVMSSTPQHDTDPAYPEPPASPLWHRHGPKPAPLTPERQRRNRELLAQAS